MSTSINGPIAVGNQRAMCTYGAKALDLNISISVLGLGVKFKKNGLIRVITMALNALNEGGDVVVVRHGGCEGGRERKIRGK